MDKPRILVVEDDEDVARLLQLQLQRDGYEVALNTTGAGFLQQAGEFGPALVILDLMLPGTSGLELLQQLRREPRFAQLPVIVLTAMGDEAARVRGLDLGADDYVTKPFGARELVARVRARLRTSASAAPEILEINGLALDLRARTAQLYGNPLELSDTEFRMLAFLMKNPGKAFTRREILDAVWSPQHFITERTVDVYMLRLRGKLNDDSENPRFLAAVRRVGYRFEPSGKAAPA